MSDSSASFLGGIKNPAYTGENRCVPCTIVNALIALAVSVLAFPFVPLLGVAVLVLSALLIYLRGYIVPGTPELIKRYLPERVLALFGKNPVEERKATEAAGPEGKGGFDDESFGQAIEEIARRHERAVDPESFLEDSGAIEPDGDDYRLVDEFADAAHDRMVAYQEESIGIETLSALFETETENIEELDRGYPAYRVGIRVRKWPSEGARIADVASHETLTEYTDEWAVLPLEQRLDMLAWLRGLHEACPVCDGETRFSDNVIESCCGQFRVTTIACGDCGERLREFDPSKVGDREDLKGITP